MDYIRSGIVKLKTGGYRLLIELPSINIELMEGEEREMVLQQYRQVLNAIDFPFQFLQQSRIVDVSEYLSMIEGKIRQEKNHLIQEQLRYYSNFLYELIRDRSVLTKKFFFVISFDEAKEEKKKQTYTAHKNKTLKEKKRKKNTHEDDVLEEEKRFEKARKQLYARGSLVERAFRRFGISPKILNDDELRDLFYTAYNKDRSVIQSLKNQELSDLTAIRVKAKREG